MQLLQGFYTRTSIHWYTGEAVGWMWAMRAADMCVSRPVPSSRRPHRPSSADGLDRIPVREPKCFLVSQEKINTLKWENKPGAPQSKQWNQVAPGRDHVCTKPFLPRSPFITCRRWHHLWPPGGLQCLVTHTAPLLHGLSLTVMRAWWWRRIGDKPAVPRAHARTHTLAGLKRRKVNNLNERLLLGLLSNNSSCPCQSNGDSLRG